MTAFIVARAGGVAPSITSPSVLPSGTQSSAYTYTMAAFGGSPPYTWSLVSQTGTNSFSVSSAGVISSSALHVETDSLTIQVQDSVGATASGVFSVQIVASAGGSYSIRAPQAGDFYLDTTAGVDGSGTIGSPWNTISQSRLKANLSAGTALWVRQGSTVTLPDMSLATYPQLQSGTVGSRIIFSAYPIAGNPANGWESATISKPTTGGVAFGGGDYWDIANFAFSCFNTLFILGNSSGSGSSCPTNYWRFINNTGVATNTAYTDNAGVISADSNNDYLEIVLGGYSASNSLPFGNGAAIYINQVPHVNIIGIKASGGNFAIYFKHNPNNVSAGIVKNCIIQGGNRNGIGGERAYMQYVNCAFDGSVSTGSLGLDEGGGGVAAHDCTINHCTFLNSKINQGNQGDGPVLNCASTNNVLAGTAQWNTNAAGTAGTYNGNTIDYSAVATTAGYQVPHYQTLTLAQIQSGAFGPAQEAHAVGGTVALVGGTSPGFTPANWALTGGSVGHSAASDGADIGVNAANLLTVN